MKQTTYSLNLPSSLALLGDLHGRPFQPVIDSLRQNKPQIIAIAGDIVSGHHPADDVSPLVSQKNILPFLENCAAIAPSFLSLGNHEWMLDEKDLDCIRNTGVTLLDNAWASCGGIVLGGLTSAVVLDYRRFKGCHGDGSSGSGYHGDGSSGSQPHVRYPKPDPEEADVRMKRLTEPDLSWLDEYTQTPGCHILLCHHPEYYPKIPDAVDWILSAHAHGGQWRFYNPKTKKSEGLFAPGQGLFPRWTRGIYDNRLIVTAGLSNTAKIPRFFNPREIVYLH